MIQRRSLLIGLGAFGGLLALAGLRFGLATDRDAVVAVIRKKLSYLRLEEAGVQQFASDLAATHQIGSKRLRILSAAGPLYSRLMLSGHSSLENGIRNGEERVVTLYLLSSDFFLTGSDETRTVRYLGFYDPSRPCGNPFARPVVTA